MLAGDECVVAKAGNQTQGLDYFFSSLMQKAVPGLSFFTLALVGTKQRRSNPVQESDKLRIFTSKANTYLLEPLLGGPTIHEKI